MNIETIASVELYNLWEKGARFPKNGYYVARYVAEPTNTARGGWRRVETLKNFGTDESGAREFAAQWNANRGNEGAK